MYRKHSLHESRNQNPVPWSSSNRQSLDTRTDEALRPTKTEYAFGGRSSLSDSPSISFFFRVKHPIAALLLVVSLSSAYQSIIVFSVLPFRKSCATVFVFRCTHVTPCHGAIPLTMSRATALCDMNQQDLNHKTCSPVLCEWRTLHQG